ncbi:MAG: xylulose 5-phosphate 3-epimerase [Parcubacteria group bacterium]|nr:xylulose 5-phosphate 3-epimerase [Parcubacteria group bacterium]
MKSNYQKLFLSKLGVMQGRIVNQERKKIQSFPWNNWEKEFKILNQNKFNLLEWTVDNEKFFKNPINSKKGRRKINKLKKNYKIKINSLTTDFFMEKPFFKEKVKKNMSICFKKLKTILMNANKIKIKFIIVPLVDNSSLKKNKIDFFIKKISKIKNILRINKQMILFESDFAPKVLLKFIKRFDTRFFGINYDTGNSASLGYKFENEIIYFKFVKNIHLKDRLYNGETKRLGEGDFNFKKFISFIIRNKYKGNFIFQTARSKYNKHLEEIIINKNYIIRLISNKMECS